MAVEKVFHVLTEFRFDIQSAVAHSSMLQEAVGKISGAADGALFSLTKLANFASYGLGLNLSILGVAGAALKSNENFQKSILSFSNIISSNMDVLNGDIGTFNDRMLVSDKILKNVAKTAREFSLDESSMLGTVKGIAPVLVREGLAGRNFGNAIDMARMFEKSAPTLGVDTGLAQGQLINSILGNASMNDTLFRRLATETKAFDGLRGKGGSQSMAQAFNKFSPEKRFEMLSKALKQFSSDADVNAAMTGLLSQRLNAIKNQLIGIDGVLRPLGQVLTASINPALSAFSQWLNSKGRVIGQDLAKLVEGFVADPQKLFVALMQMRALKDDLARAGKVAHTIGLTSFVLFLGRLAMTIPGVNVALMGLLRTLAAFTGIGAIAGGWAGIKVALIGAANAATIISVAFGLMKFAVTRIFAPLLLVTTLFQIISRAKAYAKIADLKSFAENADKLLPAIGRVKDAFKRLTSPFETVIDKAARFIAPLFAISTYAGPAATILETLASVLDFGGDASLVTIAGMYGAFVVMMQLWEDIPKAAMNSVMQIKDVVVGGFGVMLQRLMEMFAAAKAMNFQQLGSLLTTPLDFSGVNVRGPADIMQPQQLAAMFNSALDDMFSSNLNNLNNPAVKDKNVSNQTTHIGKIEIRQDFKENQEPDRIAHSLVNTLKELATNPTQSAGRSFAGALTR